MIYNDEGRETHPALFSVLKFYHFKEVPIIVSMEIHFHYGIMTNVNTMPSSSFDLHISPAGSPEKGISPLQ